jgi:hypothetical protein
MASLFKNAVAAAVGTSLTDVYTVPALTSTTVIGLSVANVAAAQITCSVSLTKGATAVSVVKDAPIPVGSSLILFGGDQKLVAEAGNKISVISSAAASADVIISVLEIA